MYRGLLFNKIDDKTVVIDIEGIIGLPEWITDDEDKVRTKEKMKAELKTLANLKASRIIVNINSPGGSVNHGLSIYDLLAENQAEVITKVNGMTASSATIIAMAAKKENRRMSDNSLMLVHYASTIALGNKNEIGQTIDDLKKVDERLVNIYVKATGTEKAKIEELMNEFNGTGKWITADEAKEYGFVGEVYEPMQAAAMMTNDSLKQYGLPPVPQQKNQTTTDESMEQVAERTASTFFDKIKSLFDNHKNHLNMKDFQNITNLLGALESKDGKGVFLNEEQLGQIDASLAKVTDLETKLQAANTEKDTAVQERDQAKTDYQNAIDAFNGIDDTVKNAEKVEDKVKAITDKINEKPANPPQTPVGKGGGEDTDEDVDWDTINNLSHNKEVDENL